MIGVVPSSPIHRRGSAVVGLLFALACLAPPAAAAAPALPDWDAAKKGEKPADKPKGAALPDWDAAKKGESGKKKDPPADGKTGDGKTAPLPDWDAAKKKKPEPTKPPAKTPKKKPVKGEPAPIAEPEPEPAPEPEPPEAAPEPEPEATPAPPPEDPPVVTVEPPPVTDLALAPVDGPEPAIRTAKRMMISGGVLVGVGFGGVGAMTAGFLSKDAARGDTLIAAGAAAGALSLAIGFALLGQGARDLKALRRGQSARLQVAPTLGGLVVRGRF